jgi:hypothetical protein
MKTLHSLEISAVSGGYARLDENTILFDVYAVQNDNTFKGRILHFVPNAPMHKEKNFPAIRALRD